MRRRDLLGATGLGLAGLAGCAGLFEDQAIRTQTVLGDRPDAVYYPTHVEGMAMVGTREQDGYGVALSYTYPHRFWLLTGTHRSKVEIASEDSVHLMLSVWETGTGLVAPDAGPQVTVSTGGETVADLPPWPMLSQPMGFHFGDNVALEGDGEYRVEVALGPTSTRRTGASLGRTTVEFDFEFSQSELEEIDYRDIPSDREGTRGAVAPMGMAALPSSRLPAAADLPGEVRGSAASGDAELVVTTLSDPGWFDEEGPYLAVSPRTPHNRYLLPMMHLSATLARDGETLFDGDLTKTVDPDLGYHYGAAVPEAAAGDELTVSVDSPPQTARHEGYETAFVEMDEFSLTL